MFRNSPLSDYIPLTKRGEGLAESWKKRGDWSSFNLWFFDSFKMLFCLMKKTPICSIIIWLFQWRVFGSKDWQICCALQSILLILLEIRRRWSNQNGMCLCKWTLTNIILYTVFPWKVLVQIFLASTESFYWPFT